MEVPRANMIYARLMLALTALNITLIFASLFLLIKGIVPGLLGAMLVLVLFAWCSYGYPLQKKSITRYLEKRGLIVQNLN